VPSLAQVQEVRNRFDKGEVADDVVVALAGAYQGWQNDQVVIGLFDPVAHQSQITAEEGMETAVRQPCPSITQQLGGHPDSFLDTLAGDPDPQRSEVALVVGIQQRENSGSHLQDHRCRCTINQRGFPCSPVQALDLVRQHDTTNLKTIG